MKKFKKILVGAAFSPNLTGNLIEACRFATYFDAKLYVVHIGAKDDTKLKTFHKIISEIDFKGDVQFIFKTGNPIKVLSDTCDENQIDLLMLGALQRKNVFKHYIGPVARVLIRKVKCSVILLINQYSDNVVKKHIVVNGLESDKSESIITNSFYVANSLSSKKVTIVEEIENSALKVDDDRSLRKAAISHERKAHFENLRIKNILSKIPDNYKENIEIKLQSIFGRSDYSIGHYARVVRADLLIMDLPKKQGFFSRLFMNDMSFILSELPTDILIIK